MCFSMRPFEWYNLNVYHVMGSWSKSSFSKNTQSVSLARGTRDS